MKPKLLITRQIFPEVLERLVPHFEIESNQSDAEWSRAELLARAADKAALFKLFTKVLAQKRDWLATFMAKWSKDWPGCGGHMHMSLWKEIGRAHV